jgi:hypothetical protein
MRLVSFAAEKLLEWRGKSLSWQQRYGPMTTWLTSKINANISTDRKQIKHEITPNWLTRKQAKIEEHLINQIQAKGKKESPENSKRMLSCGHEDHWPPNRYLMEICTQMGMNADQIAHYYPSLDPKRAICRQCLRAEAIASHDALTSPNAQTSQPS